VDETDPPRGAVQITERVATPEIVVNDCFRPVPADEFGKSSPQADNCRESGQAEARNFGIPVHSLVKSAGDHRIKSARAIQSVMMRQDAFHPAQSVKGRKKVNELCHRQRLNIIPAMGNLPKVKCAFITSDARESFPQRDPEWPCLGTAPEALLQGFAGLPEIEVHVISCVQKPMRSPEKLADNIFFHCLHVPKTGWLRTGYQGCIRAARKKLNAIRPDIVHGQGTERDCAISAVFSGFPNVITIHGNMRLIARLNRARPFSYEWLAARLETFTLPRAAGVVCITNYTCDAVVNWARKTWLVPNAVDARFFDVQPEINPEHPPTILCVGAICARKNQNAFIRALDPLAAKTKFRLMFLGVASGTDTYSREFLGLLQARPWCELAGVVSRDRLKLLLGEAALLALPSLEDNCPMVVLEAMAAGVPLIAARVGGVPELVEHGKTSLLCNPLDAAGIRDAVGKLLGDPELGRQLAAAAKKQALERFHPVVIARRHLEIYREVLNSPRGAARA